MFASIDPIVKPSAIFASNTSSISITEIMTATERPGQFVGLHFFNPVPLMKLVEVARTIVTTVKRLKRPANLARSWEKFRCAPATRPASS